MTLETAWDMLCSGNVRDALSMYDALAARAQDLSSNRQRCVLFSNRACALAASGRFEDAALSELIADRIAVENEKLGVRYALKASQLLWLAGDKLRALELALEDVNAIAAGRTRYADFGGGSHNGLNLLYMASKLSASSELNVAMRFLKQLAKNVRLKGWPQPAVRFVLDQSSYEELLLAACGTTNLDDAVTASRLDPMAHRKLVLALFYAAFKYERNANSEMRDSFTRACCSVPNPLSVYEWYMACKAMGQSE